MPIEVKMVYADVERKTSEMNNAVTSLNPNAEPPITGNTMDVVNQLTHLTQQLEQLLMKYQMVLTKNIETTNHSMEFMRESDKAISNSIQGNLLGEKKVLP